MPRPAPFLSVALGALLAWAALGGAAAQGGPAAHVGVLEAAAGEPQPYVRADDLARLLGLVTQADGGTLALRSDDVVVTLFDGSPDVLVAGADVEAAALSGPAERRSDAWWVPLDAGAPFGLVRVGADAVRDAAGRTWTLRVGAPPASDAGVRARLLRPAPGAVALELASDDTDGGGPLRTAWIADLALLPLVAPEARAAVDAALADAGEARALLLIVTSRTPGGRADGVAVDADGRVVVPAGTRHATLAGDPEAIAPDAPWIAVVWLPGDVRLDRPVTVRWEGAQGRITFRR